MIFEVDAKTISQLSSIELVQVLKRLLLAECRLVAAPLRSAFVPLQITIADGGEDGRIEWSDGPTSTEYLPARFCIFQAKAQKMTETTLKAEVAGSDSKGLLKLNRAVDEVLKRKGGYILFCSRAFTGQKIKSLRRTIVESIRACKRKLPRECSLEIYDANRIADWVNAHPAVALWLTEFRRGRSLAGFLSHDAWALTQEISKVPWIDDGSPRFSVDGVVIEDSERQDRDRNALTFLQVTNYALDFLTNEQSAIRVAGPSGFGKSRFVFELFNHRKQLADAVDSAALIYADVEIVGGEVQRLALEAAESGFPLIMIVDECPDDVHIKLSTTARRTGSRLKLVTIDVETRVAPVVNTLVIRLERTSEKAISQIAKAISPQLSDSDTGFIGQVAKGFPQMAVLAAQQGAASGAIIRSVEEALTRIVWGRKQSNQDALRALEVASLFEWIGIKGAAVNESSLVATSVASMAEDAFVEHLASFGPRGVIVRRGDYLQVSPVPLAAALGKHRLGVMVDGRLESFFVSAPHRLRRSLLNRLKWLDDIQAAKAFAKNILAPENIGNVAALQSEFGSEYFDGLVHINPLEVMATIQRIVGPLNDGALSEFGPGRRHLVWALEKLAFRVSTFDRAATLLRRLAAAEAEPNISNNATGQFQQLYQLYLAGTEAPPEMRMLVLDDGMKSANAAERTVCLGALDKMLTVHHFSRSGGAEQIGSNRLQDWAPSTASEIEDYLRSAVNRLVNVALSEDPIANQAKRILAGRIRGLLSHLPFLQIKEMISKVVLHQGLWPEAIQEVNEWLYFDGQHAPIAVLAEIRAYFDELLPLDPIERIGLFVSTWQGAFHDPDAKYDPANLDFEYGTRQLIALAEQVALSESLSRRAISRFSCMETRSLFAFSRALAQISTDPVKLFQLGLEALEVADCTPNIELFGGIIAGCTQHDPELARKCVQLALRSKQLKRHAIAMVGSGPLQRSDLDIVASVVASGEATPQQCVVLSYGQRMAHLPFDDVVPLLETLRKRGVEGLWAILEITSMVLHGGKRAEGGLLAVLRAVLVAPELFERTTSTMDGYHLETLVERLIRSGGVDPQFARALAKQLFSICEKNNQQTFHQLDESVRKALILLVEAHPSAVWTPASKLLIKRDWYVQHRLSNFLQSKHDDHMGAGLLFAVPSHLYLAWVDANRAERARLVVSWLPMVTGDSGEITWHPALQAFVDQYFDCDGVLAEIASRLQPKSWWGPLAPHLQPAITLLSKWKSHRESAIRQFAESAIEGFSRDADTSRRRDEADEIGFM